MPAKAGPLTSHRRVSSAVSSDRSSSARVTPSPKPAQPANSHAAVTRANACLTVISRLSLRLRLVRHALCGYPVRLQQSLLRFYGQAIRRQEGWAGSKDAESGGGWRACSSDYPHYREGGGTPL